MAPVTTTRRAAALLGALAALTGCGAEAAEETAPTVTVQVGEQELAVDPTQYCLAGEGQRYSRSPPTIGVAADTPITLRVPDALAAEGWSVQVFDDQLEELIGEVDVEPDTPVYTVGSSDVVPAAFYLVVVQQADGDACEGLAGAWPVGFIRAQDGTENAPPTG
jgi:hypothetical protein